MTSAAVASLFNVALDTQNSLFRDPARSTSRQEAPLQYRLHYTTLHYIPSLSIHIRTLRAQVTTRSRRSASAGLRSGSCSSWSTFRGFRGCDESLIQETARPCGRLPTGLLRSWFSLYPTTRHYPHFKLTMALLDPPLLVGFGRSPVKAPLHGRFLVAVISR